MGKYIKRSVLIIVSLFSIVIIITSILILPKVYNIYAWAKTYINTPFKEYELINSEDRATKIFDKNGILIATLYPEYGGIHIEIKYEDLTDDIINAVISSEDKNFFKHNGLDYTAIIRAFFVNMKNGRIVSGGSTITQQLAKSLIPRERSYKNKFYEAIDTLRLEKHLNKKEILTLYLNKVFFGNNCYGIGAASEIYFRKPIKHLNANESAILASIIKSGTKFNPYKYQDKLDERRIYVLSQMKKNGYINEDIYYYYIKESPKIYKEEKLFKAPHFTMYAKSAADKLNYKEITEINTTLDYSMQKEASLVIRNSSQSLHNFNVRNISCIILDAKTGEVLTMIGSLNYFDGENAGAVNGTTALRQPGSTLKPFLYAYLFDNGESPASVIGDVKTYIPSPGGDYVPENFDRKFRGPVTIRDALANSLNVPAVKWLTRYRIDKFQNILLKSGLSSIKKNPDYYGYSLVLGSAEVRLIDLASAYTIFANEGVFINSYSISSLKKSDGEIIVMPKKTRRRVVSKESAYLITSILSDRNARMGSFRNYKGLVYPFSIAIKTGTSKGSRDAWAIGYTKDYIVGLWLGDFKGSEMINITGGNGAVPILYDIFSMLNKDQKETKWIKPKTIVKREICLLSGKLRGEFCKETRMEVFSPQNVPLDICEVHKLYIKKNEDGSLTKMVFVNLPNEYKSWMNEHQIESPGLEWIEIQKNGTEEKNVSQSRLVITSPTEKSIYKIDSNLPIEYQKIFISAYIPNNVESGIVYCNGDIIGSIEDLKKGDLKWKLKHGDYAFYIEAKLKNDKLIKSSRVHISVE